MTYYNYRGVAMPESAPEQSNIKGTSAGNETVQAPAGDSSVSGEGGGDVLLGSSGDNRFWITDRHDTVVETAGGVDTMIGWMRLNAAPGIENLIVHMDFNHAYGNDLDNLIIVDGRQWIYGGKGDDVMVGAENNQTTFVVRAGEGNDVIYNWNGGSQLQLRDYGFTTPQQIYNSMSQVGQDMVLRFGNGESLTFRNTTAASFHDSQFLMPLDRSKLGQLTFDDEFDTLDVWSPYTQTGKWATDFGGNLKDPWAYTLVSNGEAQVYTSADFQGRGEHNLGLNPFSVDNGVLTITAQQIPLEDRYATWGREFSSGMLNTKGMFEQKYGYFEIRAEMNQATGAWPAFWLVPSPYVAEVEADVFEALGSTPYVDYRRAYGADQSTYDDALKIDATGFHTYGMLWTATEVSFYIDDVLVVKGATPANWTDPMGMVLNMAVGGWGGNPDYSQFPAGFRVDYVRAYGLSDGSTITETGQHETPVFTLRDAGAAPGGVALQTVTFADGNPVAGAKLAFFDAPPAAGQLPRGQVFAVWQDGAKVYGAVAYDGALQPATLLSENGSVSAFTHTGTWLPDGRVAVGFMQGGDAWAMVVNPNSHTLVKHELGAAAGDVRFIPLQDGRLAMSWDAPNGQTMARGFDPAAYGDDGWFGLTRAISGDLLGVSGGKLVAASGSGQQLYEIAGPGQQINAAISIRPDQQVEHTEGDAGGTLYTFTLIRDWETNYESSVSWRVAPYGGNGAQADDFVGGVLPTGTVTFGIGETTKYVQVWVQGDGQFEADEMFRVTLFNQVNAKLSDATADGVIFNDDAASATLPKISLATTTLSQVEGNAGLTPFNFTVTRTGDLSGTSTVNWTATGSGANPVDAGDMQNATMPSGTLTFAAGESSKTITVNVAADQRAEPNETFTVTLTNGVGATFGTATATGTVVDDDGGSAGGGKAIGFATTSATVGEGNAGLAAFSYTVTRTGDTSAAATVKWSVTGSGSAPADAQDFQGGVLPAGTLSFAAGETSKTITFSAAGDTAFERDETFTVTLSNASGAAVGAVSTATGTILNDDADPLQGKTYTSPGSDATMTGGAGADTFYAGQGYDVITGGGGADHFVFGQEPWAPIDVKDFAVGQDVLDFSSLFRASGYAGSDPVADKYVYFQADGANTLVLFDRDATGTAQQWPNYILKLEGVQTSGLTWAQLSGASAPTSPPPPPPVSPPPPPVSPPPPPPVSPPPPPPPSSSGRDIVSPGPNGTITGTAGADTIHASQGYDVITGGAGADVFAFDKEPWAPITVTDFALGGDRLDLSALFRAAAYTGSDPLADKYIYFQADGANTLVLFDRDATGTAQQWPNYILKLEGVQTSGLTWAQLSGSSPPTSPPPPPPPPASSGQNIVSPGPNATITGTAGDDTIHASQGYDVITGGGGADVFTFDKEPWAPITIKDFTHGVDHLDLRALFDAVGYTGTDPWKAGYLVIQSDGNGGSQILFDRDASAPNQQWPNYIIHVEGVAPSALAGSDWIFQ